MYFCCNVRNNFQSNTEAAEQEYHLHFNQIHLAQVIVTPMTQAEFLLLTITKAAPTTFFFISSDNEASSPVQLDCFSAVVWNILHDTSNVCREHLQEAGTRTEHHWSNRSRTQRNFTH